MLVANKLIFYGLPILKTNVIHVMGKPSKTNLFATNMSYRLPKLKIISWMTNIITAVMLIVFSMPRTMFYVVIKKWVFEGQLCRLITFGNDNIMAYQWKKLYAIWPLRSSWYAQLVMKCNICGARSRCTQVRARARYDNDQEYLLVDVKVLVLADALVVVMVVLWVDWLVFLMVDQMVA